MFGSLGGGEILVLILVGLIVFGPERLPTVARDAAKVLRQLRQMATAARDEINTELGPDVADLDLRSLHPRTFVQKHLFGEDDESRTLSEPEPAHPAEVAPMQAQGDGQGEQQAGVSLSKTVGHGAGSAGPTAPPFDADAT